MTGTVDYSPNNFADSGDAFYYTLGVAVPLSYEVTADAHFGRQYIDDEAAFGLPDRNYWGAGLAYNLEGFDLRLYYTDTDLNKMQCTDGCDARGVFSVSRGF